METVGLLTVAVSKEMDDVYLNYPIKTKGFAFKKITSPNDKPCKRTVYKAFKFYWWPCQESNLDLELRKLLYYPLYYKAKKY